MEKSAESAPANTVDEYLQNLPATMQELLEKVRQDIKMNAPQAEEVISYQIPTYKYLGSLLHFAAFEKHCSLIVVKKEILQLFKEELKSYKTTGTTIHFTPDKPLPEGLVGKIVKIRIRENEELNAAKLLAKAKK